MKLYFLLFIAWLCSIANAQELVFIEFKDKPNASSYFANPLLMLSQDALQRRTDRKIEIDLRDVPIHQAYSEQIKSKFEILGYSKWLNGVVVEITAESQREWLQSQEFVQQVQTFVRNPNAQPKSKIASKFYEKEDLNSLLDSDIFIQQLNLQALHEQGFTGKNVKLAVFDSGFWGVDVMDAFQYIRENNRIRYTYDFVQKTQQIYANNTHTHGTMVLSNISAKTASYTGTGYDTDLYLFRTEYAPAETPLEMVYWVMAAERADSLGVAIINSSLGYYDFDDPRYNYTHAELDGNTAYITKGANVAVEKGIIVVNAVGNERANAWGKMNFPADSNGVLAIGAVFDDGFVTGFSSYGPTADNRIKPELMAMGGYVPLYNYYFGDYFTTASGTSFSSPIIAGAIASLIQGKSEFTVDQLKSILFRSADRYTNPDNDYGYGIPDFAKAKQYLDEDLSIQTSNKQTVLLYPNPTKAQLHIKSNAAVEKVEVIDMKGQIIRKFYQNDAVSLQGITQGVYLVKVYFSDGETITQKVLKE